MEMEIIPNYSQVYSEDEYLSEIQPKYEEDEDEYETNDECVEAVVDMARGVKEVADFFIVEGKLVIVFKTQLTTNQMDELNSELKGIKGCGEVFDDSFEMAFGEGYKSITLDLKTDDIEIGKFGGGGSISEGNYHMILSQAKEVQHHVSELQDILKKEDSIEAWVVAKMENVSSTLSDVTHYLDGKSEMPKAKRGMKVDKIEYPSISLKEKDLNDDQAEIYGFIENYEPLNRQMDAIRKNLMTKIARGQFDEKKAPKIFIYLIDNGLKSYEKLHGDIKLSKKEKEEMANNMVIDFMSEAEQGNYENETFLPKKYLAEDGMFIMTYDIYDEDGELEASGLVAQDVVDYANLIWYYDMLDDDGEEIDDIDVAKDYLEQCGYEIKSNSSKSATNKKKVRRASVK